LNFSIYINNYHIELEDQFDTKYSKYIDEIRNNKNINESGINIKEIKKEKNNINKEFEIKREKSIENKNNRLKSKYIILNKDKNINVINQNKKLNNEIKSFTENNKNKKILKPNILTNNYSYNK